MLSGGLKVSRINGIFLLGSYGAYLAHLFFLYTNRDGTGLFFNLWIYGTLPAVVIAILSMGTRAWRARSA